ncbi:MAG TPA: cation diffusion facilitator family transporter, partial [Candidatus Limnocylindrales bacterium]|nr:cation diffusion facilitator family transporter [Candidatus Limnocylindrales bacterium]
LTCLVLAVEVVGGLLSHSLAVLSDAGHILTDVVALGLAWFALRQSVKPADLRHTYGHHRSGILAAMANGALLVVIVVAIIVGAVQRFLHPQPVQGAIVFGTALIAIAINAYLGVSLSQRTASLNVRAARLHVLSDLAGSVGVAVAGLVILATGWLPADAIISLGIAALIAWGAGRLVLETIHILLEGTPEGVDLTAVRARIAGMIGVDSVHDLHVWMLAPEQVALSCHVVVPEAKLSDGEHLVRELELALCGEFGVGHTTIQLEACHPCQGETDHALGEHTHPHGASGRAG